MSEVSLNGGLERSSGKAMTLKPGLPRKPQDIGDVRVMGDLPKRVANREWKQPKTKKYAAVNSKAERVGDLKRVLTSELEMQSLEFAQSVFSLALVQYMPPSLLMEW